MKIRLRTFLLVIPVVVLIVVFLTIGSRNRNNILLAKRSGFLVQTGPENVVNSWLGDWFPPAVVSLQYGNGSSETLNDFLENSLVRFSEIESLSISAEVTDETLQFLPYLPRLKHLEFGKLSAQNGCLGVFSRLPNIQSISMSGDITDVALLSMPELAELRAFHLSSHKATNVGLAKLDGFKNLTAVRLWAVGNIGNWIEECDAPNRLTGLYLGNVAITPAELSTLHRFSELKDLRFDAIKIPIGQMPAFLRLRTASFEGCDFSDDCFLKLHESISLGEMVFIESDLSDNDAQQIAQAKTLTKIVLSRSAVPDSSYRHFQALPMLKELSLFGPDLNVGALQELCSIPSLRTLRIWVDSRSYKRANLEVISRSSCIETVNFREGELELSPRELAIVLENTPSNDPYVQQNDLRKEVRKLRRQNRPN